MQTECAYCKKPISKKPSSIQRSHAVYCSAACANAAKRTGESVKCAWCGRSFYKARSDVSQSNLCSAKCRNAWLGHRNTTIMNVKGHTPGHKAPHLTALNEARNPFCRIAEDPGPTRSSLYRPIAASALQRPLRQNEEVHHINGDRRDNRPENLCVMTAQEHRRLHMSIAISRYRKAGDDACQKKRP